MGKNDKTSWVALFALLFFSSVPQTLWSEEPASGSPVRSERAAVNPVPATVSQEGVKVEKTAEGKYYLDFKAATLINVLSVISSLSGINFIAGKEVGERQVNMTLDNVSLEDALQSLRHGCNVNYDFIPGRNIYLFRASADAPEQPSLVTKVFKLHFIQASRVKDIETTSSGSSSSSSSGSNSSGGGLVTLKVDDKEPSLEESAIYKAVQKILSERGRVSVDSRSNSLVVTDTEDRLNMIEAAIIQLDRPLDQVLINVLLVETFEDLDRELGVEWGDENGVFGTIRGAQQATSFPFVGDGATGGSSESIWEGLTEGFTNIPKQFNPTKNTGTTFQATAVDDTVGIRDFSSFQVSVKAMEEAQKLKVLAKPKILVLDNHAAIIKIATNAAIGTTSSTQAGGAGTETNSTERSEIGTILRVVPLINTNDRVTMTVEPTFATLDPSRIAVNGTGAASGETGDPTVRTARTTLMLNDGQTIALGGLLLSQQQNNNRKVPFFGNIPLVGKAFFTSNSKKIQDRELILFVTPYIIRDPSALETASVPDKRMMFEDERAPFWKVKQKEWYKELKDGPEKPRDYDQYFDVRKKLMNATLDTMSQNVAVTEAKTTAKPVKKAT